MSMVHKYKNNINLVHDIKMYLKKSTVFIIHIGNNNWVYIVKKSF